MSNYANAVHFQGFLKVKSSVFSGWKSNWFQVVGTTLMRFKRSTDVSPLDSWDLTQAAVVNGESLSGKKKTIAIVQPSKTPTILLAASSDECELWISRLQVAAQGMSLNSDDACVETFEAVLDPCVVADKQMNILGWNKQAEVMFGYKKSEVLGKNVTMLMPASVAKFHASYVDKYYATGKKKLLGIPRNLTGLKKNGQEFPIYLSLGEITAKAPNSKCAFVAIFRPVEVQPTTPALSPLLYQASTILDSSPSSRDSIDSTRSSDEHRNSTCSVTSTITINTNNNSANVLSDSLTLSSSSTVVKKSLSSVASRIKTLLELAQSDISDEYDELEKRYLVLQNRAQLLEHEHERLMKLTKEASKKLKSLHANLSDLRQSSDKYPMAQMLKKTSTYYALLTYCQQRKCSEAVMFYKEADDFKAKYTHASIKDFWQFSTSELVHDAEGIVSKFLVEGAPFQINTSKMQVNAVMDRIVKNPTPDLFTRIQEEIIATLSQEVYRDFCNSSAGKLALAELSNLVH